MNILYVGSLWGTSLHRARALARLGHHVQHIEMDLPRSFWAYQLYRVGNRLRRPPDLQQVNAKILESVQDQAWDVLWIDKGLTVRPATLRRARQARPQMQLVAYSPDDMHNPSNQSARYLAGIPEYDLHVTTKSYNVAELLEMGAREALFVDNAYEPEAHRPLELTPAERKRYTANVGFVGTFEKDRARQMLSLAREGIEVDVWGSDWDRFGDSHPNLRLRREHLDDVEFPKALNAIGINLAFLRKANRDLQTTRSIEIPACGAFMLAERTDAHLRLFAEGKEAEYFDGFDELLSKCRHYLEHPALRATVAATGRARCLSDGYSNDERVRSILSHISQRRSPAG